MIPGLSGISYEQRFVELDLFSLEQRRPMGDMILVGNMLKGLDAVHPYCYFTVNSNSRTCDHQSEIAGGATLFWIQERTSHSV